MKRFFFLVAVLSLILSGCATAPETVREVKRVHYDHSPYLTDMTLPPDSILDVRELRQDHTFYLTDATTGSEHLSLENQMRMDRDYNNSYFSVWHMRYPYHALPERVRNDFNIYAMKPGYAENKRKHPADWIRKLENGASLVSYPNILSRGITTRNTNLRELPTNIPHFSAKDGDSKAWPFDNLQRSSVPANTPVFVCHLSADKAWALVETSFTYGWVPTEDFAFVDDEFVKNWETGRYAVITREHVSVLDERNRFLMQASVGHIFPLEAIMNSEMKISVAMADPNRQAVIRSGFVPVKAAAQKPLRFNPVNAAKIANEMTGEPYGWGGLYGRRDCSATTRDFFAVFGIWLPRHSSSQVKDAGLYIDLRGLSREEKERTIIENGVPYLSLLWRKGHIMLYIGHKDGRVLIFHNMWGVRTRDHLGHDGRKIVGQAVITTLMPGRELPDFDPSMGTYIDHIAAMNILIPTNRESSTK